MQLNRTIQRWKHKLTLLSNHPLIPQTAFPQIMLMFVTPTLHAPLHRTEYLQDRTRLFPHVTFCGGLLTIQLPLLIRTETLETLKEQTSHQTLL